MPLPGAVGCYDEDCRGSLWNMGRIRADSPAGVLISQNDPLVPAVVSAQAAASTLVDAAMRYFMAMLKNSPLFARSWIPFTGGRQCSH